MSAIDAKTTPRLVSAADAMHAILVRRADQLQGSTAGSREETELGAIADALVGYEEQRWPNGKAPGGKG